MKFNFHILYDEDISFITSGLPKLSLTAINLNFLSKKMYSHSFICSTLITCNTKNLPEPNVPRNK